jgi:hypothetical protein
VTAPDVTRRGWIVLAAVAALPAVLILGFGHPGVHAVRSMLVPGAGLVESQPLLAAAFLVSTVVATVAWVRWGADWSVVAVVVCAMAASAAWGPASHGSTAGVAKASHEFPLVVLIAGLVGWVRAALAGVPGFRWLAGRRATAASTRPLSDLPPVDRSRAIAFLALAEAADPGVAAEARAPDIARRARLVGLLARGRRGGDPFRVDHAHARAALALTGGLDAAARRRFVDDSRRTRAGVPASEPGWVRTLDATLATAALEDLGGTASSQRWRAMLDGPLAMRRGHRPAWWWSPLGFAAGRCLDWEHAAATAVAHERGWIGADDWLALRQRVLGAAARGSSRRDDERLIASGRAWLALVDDPAAERILARPTVCHDPLAVAIDTLAQHLRATHRPAAIGGTS